MSTGTTPLAVFILTHGRPKNVKTYRTLRQQGYSGPIWLIVDNEDDTLPAYREVYGDQVIVFDKQAVAEQIDEGDNFQERRAIIYARNACFDIAEDLGYEWFLELDDDYLDFRFKYDANLIYTDLWVPNLDRLFADILAFYQSSPALALAISQGGDYIGGEKSTIAKTITMRRKAMNTLFLSTKRRFQFFGRVNEDVNTYVTLGNRGHLFLTVMQAGIQQTETQQNTGGMVDLYKSEGTYRKSFYSVMYAPSCVTVRQIGHVYPRIHHHINWNHAVPKILREEHRKP